MKKLVCLLLAVVLLLCCFAFLILRKPVTTPLVTTPLTQEDIDAIPVATADMTPEQLRQICLDFFRLQLTFQWTPAKDFEYTIDSYQKTHAFKNGTVYAGLPYQSSGSDCCSLYLAMQYYDHQTGVLDNTGVDGQEFSHLVGNQCLSGVFWAWARVVNSTPTYLGKDMTKINGFLSVGDYEYNTPAWSAEGVDTKAVCRENGEQRMFEAYALVKPADGLNRRSKASHTRMVSATPVVVRNGDGTINGEESYVLFMDQGSSWKDYTADDGSTVQLQGNINKKATFAGLFKSGYVPFTFAELLGTDPIEKAEVTLELPDTVTVDDMVNGILRSNYAISFLRVTLTDDSGKVTYEQLAAADRINAREMYLAKAMSHSEIEALLEKGDQKLTVQVQSGTGELLTAYEGTLTAAVKKGK